MLGLVIVPVILVAKVVGLGVRVAFGTLGLLFGVLLLIPVALVMLPVAALVGGLLLLKLLILAAPLLLVGLLIWVLVTLTRRPAAV